MTRRTASASAPTAPIVFEKGVREIGHRHGTVVVSAPRDVSLAEIAPHLARMARERAQAG